MKSFYQQYEADMIKEEEQKILKEQAQERSRAKTRQPRTYEVDLAVAGSMDTGLNHLQLRR